MVLNFGVSFWVGVSDAVDFVCEVGGVVWVVTEFCTSADVVAVTVDVGVGDTGAAVGLVGLMGDTGETGLVTLVGFVKLFTHVFCVVSVQMPWGQLLVRVLVI